MFTRHVALLLVVASPLMASCERALPSAETDAGRTDASVTRAALYFDGGLPANFDSTMCPEGTNVIVGTSGHDTLNGTEGDDCIFGLQGNDTIYGHGGDDILIGGAGNDILHGGDGEDLIVGNQGGDILNGDGGRDSIDGGTGNDSIDGGAGNDQILGGAHDDVIHGGDGDDRIDGQTGNDTIDGGAGNDVIYGGAGDDVIDAGDGDDVLVGNQDNDTLNGGAGNDSIDGQTGNDTIDGGAGNDTIDGGAHDDVVSGGSGNDVIFGGAGNDELNGDDGDDTLVDNNVAVISGGGGNDSCSGGDCESTDAVSCIIDSDCQSGQRCVAGGVCVHCVTDSDCDDSNPNTSDICTPSTGCSHVSAPNAPRTSWTDISTTLQPTCSGGNCHFGGDSTQFFCLTASESCWTQFTGTTMRPPCTSLGTNSRAVCADLRIAAGTMPQGRGCEDYGDTDPANCVAAEVAPLLQGWIDIGTPLCAYSTPQPDTTCDRVDDDCDGRYDEAVLSTPITCTQGSCSAAGTYACVNGDMVEQCQFNISAELCDGLDNDCDGSSDELNPGGGAACSVGVGTCAMGGTVQCAGGSLLCDAVEGDPGVETCDGFDNDCDNSTDEGNPGGGGACTVGAGVCQGSGTFVCLEGTLQCTASEGTGSPEVCDGIDNNCIDGVDEGNPGGGAPCSVGQGACQRSGTIQCITGSLQCGASAGDPTDEACNGIDDNCNGTVDEATGGLATSCGDDECATTGTLECVGGSLVDNCNPVREGVTEVCGNLVDENCDGDLRDGCPEATEPWTSWTDIAFALGGSCAGCHGADLSNAFCLSPGDTACYDAFSLRATYADTRIQDGSMPQRPHRCDGYGDPLAGCVPAEVQPLLQGWILNETPQCAYLVARPDDTCDRVDDDCDGRYDEAVISTPITCTQASCSAAGTHACVNGDMVDQCPSFTPTAELCDGIDNDCDATTPDGAAETWINSACDSTDLDQCTDDVRQCVGGVQACVDQGAARLELCDGIDSNCNGISDADELPARACGNCGVETCLGSAWSGCGDATEAPHYRDTDGDGFGDPNVTNVQCPGLEGWVLNATDCNDACSACQPGHSEGCDDLDNDCDGTVDEDSDGDPTTCGLGPCARDGFMQCVDGALVDNCVESEGEPETCDDAIDNDCDGVVNNGCTVSNEPRISWTDIATTLSPTCTSCHGPSASNAFCLTASDADCWETFTDPANTWVAQCTGMTRAECADVRIQDGTMPQHYPPRLPCNGYGDPAAGCVAADVEALLQGWIADSTPRCAYADYQQREDSTCDRIDDDCDGTYDEAFVGNQEPCGLGECDVPRNETCVNGTLQDTCPAGDPPVERCDTRDDDCDGATDEGGICDPSNTYVGAACDSDDDCIGPGMEAGFCYSEADQGIRGGVCLTLCDAGVCPLDSWCFPGTVDNNQPDLCIPACDATGLCRNEEATCILVNNNPAALTYCLPYCFTDADCHDGRYCNQGSCYVDPPSRDINTPDDDCDGYDDNGDGFADEDYLGQSACASEACGGVGDVQCVNGLAVSSCDQTSPECVVTPTFTQCRTDDDCVALGSGFVCATEGDGFAGGRCIQECDETTVCGAGTACLQGGCLPTCTPDGGCTTAGDVCLFTESGRICMPLCSDDSECLLDCNEGTHTCQCSPETDECDGIDNDCDGDIDENLSPEQCLPACTQQSDCAEGVCDTNIGRCVCGPETCNGIDDDCNGAIDNGFVLSCDAVGCTSTLACVNGTPVDCTGYPPSLDYCNGTDDDCDGNIDEGYVGFQTVCGACGERGDAVCVNGTPGNTCPAVPCAEDCDSGVDEDGDNRIDCEDRACTRDAQCVANSILGTSCSTSAECPINQIPTSTGIYEFQYCELGYLALGGNLFEPRGECIVACPSGSDDECPAGGVCVGNRCHRSCDLAGTCGDDQLACARHFNTNGMRDACRPIWVSTCPSDELCDPPTGGTCYGPNCNGCQAEICNGLDDDCDEIPDDGFESSCGTGGCVSLVACINGVSVDCGAGQADDTTCDGFDDDCDSNIDEDYAPVTVSCGCGITGTTSCSGGVENNTCPVGACIENCVNDIDDDEDGFTDCTDTDCTHQPACVANSEVGTQCSVNTDCPFYTYELPVIGTFHFRQCQNLVPGVGGGENGVGYCLAMCSPELGIFCPGGSVCADGLCLRACDVNGACGDPALACQDYPTQTGSIQACVPHCDSDAQCPSGKSCVQLPSNTPGTLSAGVCRDCASDDATCDSQDDDCDGLVDEDWGDGTGRDTYTCGIGACERRGDLLCAVYEGVVDFGCTPGTPTTTLDYENDVDDDCDGNTDEDSCNTAPCENPCQTCNATTGICANDDTNTCGSDTECSSFSCNNGVCEEEPSNEMGQCGGAPAECRTNRCRHGACTGEPDTALNGTECGTPDDNECTAQQCNNGTCTLTNAQEDTACTWNGHPGQCRSGECSLCVTDCDDRDPCTVDTCDPENGTCSSVPGNDFQTCGDNRACWQGSCYVRQTYAQVSQSVFDNRCINCHGGQYGLSFGCPTDGSPNATSVTERCQRADGTQLPRWECIARHVTSDFMPLTGDPLSVPQKSSVYGWVANGHPIACP